MTLSVQEPKVYFNPPSYTMLAWLENAVEARCNKSSTVVEMSMVGLLSRDYIFSPSWLNHMLWKHKLISVIFSVHQLLQCCNMILSAETPLNTAARSSAIPKRLWREKKNHLVWDEDMVFQVSRCSDAYWSMQPHPGWSALHCNSCTAALCAMQIRTPA